jgi:hypothetical protein
MKGVTALKISHLRAKLSSGGRPILPNVMTAFLEKVRKPLLARSIQYTTEIAFDSQLPASEGDPMDSSRAIRIGGIAGLVLAPMMIVAFGLDLAIIMTSGGPPLLDPNNIGPELSRAQGVGIWPVELWLYTLMIIPGSLLAIAAYRVLRTEQDDSLAAAGLLATVLFWIFHTLHNVLMLAIFQAVVPNYTGGSANTVAMETVASTVLRIAYAIFNFGTSVGALFLVGSLAALGLATLRSAGLPRWTGYVALASSFAILGSYLQFLSGSFSNPFVVFGVLGWLLYMTWVIGTTLTLLRSRSQVRRIGQQYAT